MIDIVAGCGRYVAIRATELNNTELDNLSTSVTEAVKQTGLNEHLLATAEQKASAPARSADTSLKHCCA